MPEVDVSEKFDPYHEWLGIAASEQPPHYYRLLGIPLFEESSAVVENAANQRMAHLRTFQTGKHVDHSQRLLNEVAAARVCLLNAPKKAAYDQSLRQRLAQATNPVRSPPADAFDPGLEAVFATGIASTSSIMAKGRGKKSQSKSSVPIAVAAIAVVALSSLGLWWAFAHENAAGDGTVAKVSDPEKHADPATGVRHLKEVSPKSPDPTKQQAPRVAPFELKRESRADEPKDPVGRNKHRAVPALQADDAKTVSEPNGPEPKTEEEPKSAATSEKIAAASPAVNDSVADKAESSGEKAQPKKLVPPSAEEQKRLMGEIDEVYKPGDAKDQAAKAALARKLLEDGRKNEAKPDEQFVVLRRAGEIARDAGEVDLMLQAVDAISAAGFDIRPFQVKARLLKQLVAQNLNQNPSGGASRISAISQACVKFAEEAAAGGSGAEAAEVLDAAGKSLAKPLIQAQTAQRVAKAAARARTASDKAERQKKLAAAEADLEAIKSAQLALSECAKTLQKVVREREAIEAARLRLKTAPDDPDACLTVGRWYCFHECDWEQGLKLLAKGSDTGLKLLAAEELASKPANAEERVARGDAWWNAAEKATGKPKTAMQRRAGQWYGEALPDLASGLTKTKVEVRLAEVPKADAAEEEALASAPSASPPPAKAPFDEKTAKSLQTRWAKHLRVPVVETNSLGMKLTLIPPGEFEMGSSPEVIAAEREGSTDHWYTDCLRGEGPAHRVRITQPFWMGTVPVTQEQFKRVMGENPSFNRGDQFPVESVTCESAMEFCRRLSALPAENDAGRKYHLPTEAQWEFACRAGTTGLWFFSDPAKAKTRAEVEKLGEAYGWLADSGPVAVGRKRPNPFGLYDMYRSVFQWCQDVYEPDYYATSPTDDPTGPEKSKVTFTFHAVRGGGFHTPPNFARSAYRFNHPGHLSRNDVGIRVAVRSPELAAKAKGNSETQRAEQPAPAVVVAEGYVASQNSQVFHKPSCKSAANIAATNLVHYATRDEAVAAGKRPCHECNP